MRTVAPFEVGITVSDVGRLLPFYEGVLGLRVIGDMEMPESKSRPAGLSPAGYRIVRLETPSGDRLKLAQPRVAPADEARTPFAMDRRGIGYITFLVEDLKGLHRRLVDAGASVHSDGIVELRPGVWLVVATDPEGNFLEFLQYDDLATYRPPGPGGGR